MIYVYDCICEVTFPQRILKVWDKNVNLRKSLSIAQSKVNRIFGKIGMGCSTVLFLACGIANHFPY